MSIYRGAGLALTTIIFLSSASHNAMAGDNANDIYRALMPKLDVYERAYRKARAKASREATQAGGRSRSWRQSGERTRGYHSDVPILQKKVKKKNDPTPKQKTESDFIQKRPEPAPSAKPAVYQPVSVQQQPNYITHEITFEINSADLTPSGLNYLQYSLAPAIENIRLQVVSVTRSWAQPMDNVFNVVGHTDASGDAAYNQVLSQKRADAVCNFLRARGFSGQLRCYGVGESSLKNPASPYSAENRRVEIQSVPVKRF